MAMYTTAPVAKKEHKCSMCPNIIPIGERHVKLVIPPWVMAPEDVDEEGRTIYSRLDRWLTSRFHDKCYDEWVRW